MIDPTRAEHLAEVFRILRNYEDTGFEWDDAWDAIHDLRPDDTEVLAAASADEDQTVRLFAVRGPRKLRCDIKPYRQVFLTAAGDGDRSVRMEGLLALAKLGRFAGAMARNTAKARMCDPSAYISEKLVALFVWLRARPF